jgi:hypothetical protein
MEAAVQVNWTIPDWRRLPRQLLLAVLLPDLLSSAGCAAFLARTGDQASLLVDEVLGGLPRSSAMSTQEIVDALAGYDDAVLADLVRQAAREGVTGLGEGLELGEGPLNEEIVDFVERVSRSVVSGALEELSEGELSAQIEREIDVAMSTLSTSLSQELAPELEAAMRQVTRGAATELLDVVTNPDTVERTNVALRSFALTLSSELERLLQEDVRILADEVAINMGRALRTELAEPTIIQLNRAVESWIGEVDNAVSEGFRQANSVLRVLSSALGGILVIVLGILLWVVRARAALAHELRLATIERERLELVVVAMARVFAESWAVLERIDASDETVRQPGDEAIKSFLQAQLHEVRNSNAGVSNPGEDPASTSRDSRIKAILKAHGRTEWIVEHEKFADGPASFEDWIWRRLTRRPAP